MIRVIWAEGKPEKARPVYSWWGVFWFTFKHGWGWRRICQVRIDGPIDPELSPEDIAREYDDWLEGVRKARQRRRRS